MITAPADYVQAYIDKYEEPRHHVNALLRASVVTLDLPSIILYPLADAGVRTVADLLRLRSSGLRKIPNIGKLKADEVEKTLARLHLIGMEEMK